MLSLMVAKSPRIEVIDTATGATIASIPDSSVTDYSPIYSLALGPSGRRFVWINGAGHAIISDTRTGATLTSRRLPENSESGARVAWSADGAIIAICDGVAGTLSLCDGNTLDSVRTWALGHRGMPCSLAVSPDSHRIVTAAENGIARIWDVTMGTQVHELIGHGNRVLCAAYSGRQAHRHWRQRQLHPAVGRPNVRADLRGWAGARTTFIHWRGAPTANCSSPVQAITRCASGTRNR